MGVFETHDAKKYRLGSGVALQPPKPLHTIGQKRCFWVPKMGVFETHDAKKYCLGSGGGAATTHTSAHQGPEKLFLGT